MQWSAKRSFHQNFKGGSEFNWALKFFLFPCSNLSLSILDSWRQSANVLPKILLATTLFSKPVYPGGGLPSFTYYFPSRSITVEFAHLFVVFLMLSLNFSSLTCVNWSTSSPSFLFSVGWVRVDILLGRWCVCWGGQQFLLQFDGAFQRVGYWN